MYEQDEKYNSQEEEDGYQPKDADEKKANALSFAQLCRKFEILWKQRKLKSSRGVVTKTDLLQLLLPSQLIKYLGSGSPFPLLRLILPEIDTCRPHVGMKEKIIAQCWSDAMGFNKGSQAYEKLINFTIPEKAGPSAVGDFSLALYEVMKERFPEKPSSVTVGEINEMLDKLASVKKSRDSQIHSSQHNWRSSSNSAKKLHMSSDTNEEAGDNKLEEKTGKLSAKYSYQSKQLLRKRWVEQLIALNLSPLEHKWIVRILLQRLDIGLKHNSILKYYHPLAEDLYAANKSLQSLCTLLSDPEWVQKRQSEINFFQKQQRKYHRMNHIPKSAEKVVLGNTITPMLSKRTRFSSAIHDMESRHVEFLRSAPVSCVGLDSLALKFPAFICEEKLDGERMIVHVKRGIVTMHTRNGTWYSRAYSPSIGPAIRCSLSKHDVDVILDGEMISWDDGNKETISFGFNRTVARERKEWMLHNGTLDERDIDPHADSTREDKNILQVSQTLHLKSKSNEHDDVEKYQPGAQCWLKYLVFDILYIGGPDALNLIKSSCYAYSKSNSQDQFEKPGSIMNLSLFERKSILYNMISSQENQVEIVESIVVRPDGTSMEASAYFLPETLPFGYTPAYLDSINTALDGLIINLRQIDEKRKGIISDKQIAQRRASAVDSFYSNIVEKNCKEGLVFKDLISPYFPGEKSRGHAFWRKLKQDYEKVGHAADIDVVVLGGSFATGMSRAGLLSKFLVGCADHQPDGTILYMPLCKIYSGHADKDTIDRALEYTGFEAGKSYGNWYQADAKNRILPDFISKRSFQTSTDGKTVVGWKVTKKLYPDLWIRPQDSFVFTLNAGEIVASDFFSSGISLRFPRISQLRLGEGHKTAEQVDNIDDLLNIYLNRQAKMSKDSQDIISERDQNQNRASKKEKCRFLTPAQDALKKRLRRKRNNNCYHVPATELKIKKVSDLLSGLTFTVFEGNYELDRNCLDAMTAKSEGWLNEAFAIKSRDDIIHLIRKYGGKCELGVTANTNHIIGGRSNDARVLNYEAITSNISVTITDRSKNNEIFKKMIELRGILKWTFIVALIHRHSNSEQECSSSRDRILQISPRLHDFLVRSKHKSFSIHENEYGDNLLEDTSESNFQYILHQVGHQNRSAKLYDEGINEPSKKLQRQLGSDVDDDNTFKVPHHVSVYRSFDNEDDWVLKRNCNLLWPFRLIGKQHTNSRDDIMIIYPHIFGDRFGFIDEDAALKDDKKDSTSKRWNKINPVDSLNSISSCLSLAEYMGAQITSHLHQNVTHVLCIMNQHHIYTWTNDKSTDIFRDMDHGNILHKRLLEIQAQNKDSMKTVVLITPSWINAKWNE